MAFQQLKPLPVEIVGKGPGVSIGVIDDGPGHSLIWITALDASGEVIYAPNDIVRLRADRLDSLPDDASPPGRVRTFGWEEEHPQLRSLPMPGADAEYSAYP